MTILELIRKLKEIAQVRVEYDENDVVLDFQSDDYYQELLYPQHNTLIETTEVCSFEFKDNMLIIYIE